MVINGNAQGDLRFVLADDIFIQLCLDFLRLEEILEIRLTLLLFLLLFFAVVENRQAQLDALVTDIHAVARNHAADELLRLATEGAMDLPCCIIVPVCHKTLTPIVIVS